MNATNVRKQKEAFPQPIADLDRIDKLILRALQRDASVSNVALAHKVNQLGLIKDIVALLDPRQRELQSAPRGATAAPAGRAPGALVHGAEAGAVDNAVPGLTRVTRQACACPWANPCPAGSR